MDKIYFIECENDDMAVKAYVGFTQVIDVKYDRCKESGYMQCLADLGYKYGGNFNDMIKYKKKFSST